MNKESFYFPHDYEPTSDPKIQALIGEYGAVGYGVFWRIIEMLHSDSEHKLPKKKYIFIAIAKQLLTSVEQIEAIVDYCITTCELFFEEDGFFYSRRVKRNFDRRKEISEKRSIAGKLGAIAKQNLANISKEKKKKEKKKKDTAINYTEKFSLFWEKYPRKEGKAKAFEAWKKYNLENGYFNQVIRSLEDHLVCRQWVENEGKFIPHGSTWVNSRAWEDTPEPMKNKENQEKW